MKKITDFFKRYYKCIYDFNLFKSYLHEPIFKALLFLIPVFVFFVFQSYFVAMTNPNTISDSIDYYYDHVNTIRYSDITSELGDYDLTDPVNFEFFENQIQIPQNKIYDKTFEQNGKKYRLILDTQNEKEIEIQDDNRYDADTKAKIGHQTAEVSLYVNKDFVLISLNDVVQSYPLNGLDGEARTTLGIYTFLKDNYNPGWTYLLIMLVTTLFLYLTFYIVVYIISKSTIKRHGYELERGRIVRISLYCIQPGVYTYLLLNFFTRVTGLNITFVVPLIAMIAMSYVATKNLDNIKDYVKREVRKARKASKKA